MSALDNIAWPARVDPVSISERLVDDLLAGKTVRGLTGEDILSVPQKILLIMDKPHTQQLLEALEDYKAECRKGIARFVDEFCADTIEEIAQAEAESADPRNEYEEAI